MSKSGVNADTKDDKNGKRTALHVCHLSAKYSEYNDFKHLGKNRGWISPTTYSKYEADLIINSKKLYFSKK